MYETIKQHVSVKKAKQEIFQDRNIIPKIEDKKGRFVFDRGKIVQVATDFYRNLYEKDPNEQVEETRLDFNNKELVPQFLEDESLAILRKLKPEKASGPDDVRKYELKKLSRMS